MLTANVVRTIRRHGEPHPLSQPMLILTPLVPPEACGHRQSPPTQRDLEENRALKNPAARSRFLLMGAPKFIADMHFLAQPHTRRLVTGLSLSVSGI